MPVTNNRMEKAGNTSSILAALLVSLAIGALTGCAFGPKTYGVSGEGDALMNRDNSGKSLSVAVRVYQLKDATEFSKLTFDTVASGRPESDFLGRDLLTQNEIIMVPGGKYINDEKLQDGAKYLGIVALFRQPDPHYWRFLIETDKIRRKGLSFKIQDCYLILKTPQAAAIPGQPIDATPVCPGGHRTMTAIQTGVSSPAAQPAAQGSAQAGSNRAAPPSKTEIFETVKPIIDAFKKP